ncbi:MAG: hypothetical protein WBR15_07030 [Gammaproteobacteria bacterium]
MQNMRHTPLAAVLSGGLIAGTIDIGAASLINWISPVIILHAIASGILGKASFNEGLPAALLGLGLQWAMALLIATIYRVGTYKLTWARQHWVPAGVIYGVGIFIVMNYVVVPLSAAPFKMHFNIQKIGENLLAMILFGLIVAFFSRSASNGTATQPVA